MRLRTVPTYAAWLDVLEPISRVFPMAGLDNTMRRLVVSGTPVVMGLHAMGDSVCTTTPTVGWGLSLPVSGTVDLLDNIDKLGDNWTAQALALDGLVADHLVPFDQDQAAIFDAPAPDPRLSSPSAPPTRSCVRQRCLTPRRSGHSGRSWE